MADLVRVAKQVFFLSLLASLPTRTKKLVKRLPYFFFTFVVNDRDMDANLLQRITTNPDQCGGRPCIRGMRIRVTDVLDLMANGLSAEDIVSEWQSTAHHLAHLRKYF